MSASYHVPSTLRGALWDFTIPVATPLLCSRLRDPWYAEIWYNPFGDFPDASISATCPPVGRSRYSQCFGTCDPNDTDPWSFELLVSELPVAPRSLPCVLHRWMALIASGLRKLRSRKTPPFCSSMPESPKYEDLVTRILRRWMALMSSGLRELRLPVP
jgi:hypothetical protein